MTVPLDREAIRRAAITSTAQLDAHFGTPAQTSIDKVTPVLTGLEQEYVRHSPFYLLATAAADGACDVSPRGDPPGSVIVADERTLVLADRKGNKRVDSHRNIVQNPSVGLLFLVPGMDETLRVNGRATLTTHAPLLTELAMGECVPELAIVVDIAEVYMHCARAFRRSRLWDSATWPDPATVPGMAAILHDALCLGGTVEELAAEREARYRTTLY